MLIVGQTLAWAEGSALLITFKDGRTAAYVLSQKPTLTFGDATLNIATEDASTEYQRADISKFGFVDADEVSGIGQLTQGSTQFEYRNGVIRATGGSVQVYSLNGQLLTSGGSTVQVSTLPAGVYVVKMNNQTIKIKR